MSRYGVRQDEVVAFIGSMPQITDDDRERGRDDVVRMIVPSDLHEARATVFAKSLTNEQFGAARDDARLVADRIRPGDFVFADDMGIVASAIAMIDELEPRLLPAIFREFWYTAAALPFQGR